MHEKIRTLLGAYLDHELKGDLQLQIERHLSECPSCQAELNELNRVSRLLQAAPVPDFIPTERFIANLGFKLPRRSIQDQPVRKASSIWWLVPASLLGLYFFIRSVFLVSTMVSLADLTGLLGNTGTWLGNEGQTLWFNILSNLTGGQMGASQATITVLNTLSLAGNRIITSIFWQTGIFLAYSAWLAAWLRQRNRKVVVGIA